MNSDVIGKCCLFLILIIVVYFVCTRLSENYKSDDPKLLFLKSRLRQINPEIIDHITFLEDNRSYTINKKKIYMCLRDESGDYYDDNMLIFVALHELAHVMCDEIGHTEKFQVIFQDLLARATQQGIYDPTIEPIYNYCTH